MAQDVKCTVSSKKHMDSVLNEIILKEHRISNKKKLKIVFTIEVESSGVIRDVYVAWSINLSEKAKENICTSIKESIIAAFLYDKCRETTLNEEYAICNYPYYPNDLE